MFKILFALIALAGLFCVTNALAYLGSSPSVKLAPYKVNTNVGDFFTDELPDIACDNAAVFHRGANLNVIGGFWMTGWRIRNETIRYGSETKWGIMDRHTMQIVADYATANALYEDKVKE